MGKGVHADADHFCETPFRRWGPSFVQIAPTQSTDFLNLSCAMSGRPHDDVLWSRPTLDPLDPWTIHPSSCAHFNPGGGQ